MKQTRFALLAPLAAVTLYAPAASFAQGIFAPGDLIIGVDGNRNLPGNTNTGGEGPLSAVDNGNGTK